MKIITHHYLYWQLWEDSTLFNMGKSICDVRNSWGALGCNGGLPENPLFTQIRHVAGNDTTWELTAIQVLKHICTNKCTMMLRAAVQVVVTVTALFSLCLSCKILWLAARRSLLLVTLNPE